MAFNYGFYNSLNGDRRYKSDDFGELVGSLLTDGVFENIGQKLFVTAGTGMDINVGSGKAWFDNTWSFNDSAMVLEVPQSDITRPRYDTVVLDVNTDISVRENKIMIVSGDPQVNPTKPVLINTTKHHQHPLAHILVPAAATEITASNIEIVVGQTVCPFVTSILQKTDITDLYNKWEADFTAWFNNLKDQLTSNVVTNLQSQIDTLRGDVDAAKTLINNCVKYSDKASQMEAISGINDTKYVTPKSLTGWYTSIRTDGLDLLYSNPFSSIVPYSGASSATITLPKSMLEYSRVYFIGDRLRYSYGSTGNTYNMSFSAMPGSDTNFSVSNVYVENRPIIIGGNSMNYAYVTILTLLQKDSSYIHYACLEHVGGYSSGSTFAEVVYIKLPSNNDYTKLSIRFSGGMNNIYYGNFIIYGEK